MEDSYDCYDSDELSSISLESTDSTSERLLFCDASTTFYKRSHNFLVVFLVGIFLLTSCTLVSISVVEHAFINK